MKKYLLAILFGTALISCNSPVPKARIIENTEKTIKWLEKSKKPIVVRGDLVGEDNTSMTYIYTLQSDDNKFYYTNPVYLKLPDLIEDNPGKKLPEVIIRDTEFDIKRIEKELREIDKIREEL